MDRTAQIIFAVGIVTIAILVSLHFLFPDFTSFKFGPTEIVRPSTDLLVSESEFFTQLDNLAQNYSELNKRIFKLENNSQIYNVNQTEILELSDKVIDAVNRKNFDEAHFYANQILDKENGSFAYWTIAYVYSEQGLLEKALQAYDKAVELSTEDMEYILFDRGIALTKMGKYELALKDWDRVLEIVPYDEKALINKILTLKYLGRTNEQIESVSTLIELNPSNPHFLNLMGTILLDLKMPEQALPYFKQANEIDENNYGFIYNIGKTYSAMKDYETAIEYFDKSFSLHPTDSQLIEKSRALSFLDRDNEALQNLEIVLHQFPDHQVALINKAKILHKIGKLEDAIEVYDKLLELFANNTQLLQSKIDLLEELAYHT